MTEEATTKPEKRLLTPGLRVSRTIKFGEDNSRPIEVLSDTRCAGISIKIPLAETPNYCRLNILPETALALAAVLEEFATPYNVETRDLDQQIANVNWDTIDKSYPHSDWRTYVGENVQRIWHKFTPDERRAIYNDASDRANDYDYGDE